MQFTVLSHVFRRAWVTFSEGLDDDGALDDDGGRSDDDDEGVDDDGVTVLELHGRHNGLLLVLYHVGPFVVLDGAKLLGKDSDGSLMVGSLVPLVGATDGVAVVGATVGALLFHRQVGSMVGRCVSRFHHMGCRVVELVGAMVLGKDSDGSLMVGSLVPLVGATDGVAVVGATVDETEGSSVGALELLVGATEGVAVIGASVGTTVGNSVDSSVDTAEGSAVGAVELLVGATDGVAVIGTSVGASEGFPVGAKVVLKGAAVGVAVGALLFHRQVGSMVGRCVSRLHHMGCRVVELVGAMVLGKDSDGSLMVGSLVPLVGATDGVAVVGATVGSSVGILEVLVGLQEGREVSVGIRLGASVGKHVAALGNAVG